MPSSVILLENAKVVVAGRGLTDCPIRIENGRIAGFDHRVERGQQVERIDLTGLVVLPGVIDPHLHLGHGKDISRPRVPDDAARETAAAAMGGITTFIPYLMGTTSYETVFDEVKNVTEAGSRIDFGYHFIISTEDQLAAVPDYARRYGVSSYKIFMNNRGGEGARLGLPDIDDGYLFRLCEMAASVGGVVCPHPENIEVAWILRNRLKQADPEGKGGLCLWNASRPDFVEAEAVQRSTYLARVAGCSIYIVHTSSKAALEAALMHRKAGSAVTIETCPHYLTHHENWEGGVIGKINPPLRSKSDCDALWQAIADGHIDTIGTDHVHRDLSGKQGSIWEASPGCPGLETMLPVLLSEGHAKRGLSLERIAALTATHSAQAFGLSDRKGRIEIGQDADFAIIDPKSVWVVDQSKLMSSAGYSIYHDWKLTGRVVHTLVRGRFVMRDAMLMDEAIGSGRYLRRSTLQ
jgi:dihydropyrimidinase